MATQRGTNVAEIGRPLFVGHPAQLCVIVVTRDGAVPVTDRTEHAFQLYGSRTHQFSAETTTWIGETATEGMSSV